MSNEQWELLLEELQMTPVMLRDQVTCEEVRAWHRCDSVPVPLEPTRHCDPMQRYDAVVHMVTAADGAKSFYTLENNGTRTETVEQAIEMDRRTLDCWIGHEHLYIIDNYSS